MVSDIKKKKVERSFFLCCVLVVSKFSKKYESGQNTRVAWKSEDTRGAPKINVVLNENPLKLRNFVFPICCSDLHACNEFASLWLWNASCNVSVSKRTTDYFSKRKLTFSKLGFPHTQPPSQGFSAGEEMLVSSPAQKPRERGCDLPGTMGRSVGSRWVLNFHFISEIHSRVKPVLLSSNVI